MNLTIRQLEVFAAAARAASFSEAAERLGISQPSLSATIRKIEYELGLRLFDRTTRSLSLTGDGRHLAVIAEETVRDFRVALDGMAARSTGQRGRITLAVLPSVAAAILPIALRPFLAKFPGVEVNVHDVLHERAINLVRDGIANVAVTTRPEASSDLVFEELGSDRMHLVCPIEHPLAGAGPIKWQALAEHEFIALARTSSVRLLADAALISGGHVVKPRYEVEQIPSATALVAAGLGVTALPELTFAMFPHAGLAMRPLIEPVVRRGIGIVTLAGRTPSLAADALTAQVRIAFRETAVGVRWRVPLGDA